MVLEATIICVDNSEYMRDGDYVPTRFEAQQDACNLISGAKTNQNIENAIGLLTMAGDRVEVRLSPTNDIGSILSALHGVVIHGTSDFVRGIQTAQLALKHRTNKNQKQRVVCFVGSPVSASEKNLVQLGKQLKKNNVALDIISFGDIDMNSTKLNALHQAVNSSNTSHIVECPSGSEQLLSDMIIHSPIVVDPDSMMSSSSSASDGTSSSSGSAANVAALNEFGVDPNTDPELYMALRLSLEEEQRRTQQQEALNNASSSSSSSGSRDGDGIPNGETSSLHPPQADDPANGVPSGIGGSNSGTDGGDVARGVGDSGVSSIEDLEGMEGIDGELRQALLLSLQDFAGSNSSPSSSTASSPAAASSSTASSPAAASSSTASSPAATSSSLSSPAAASSSLSSPAAASSSSVSSPPASSASSSSNSSVVDGATERGTTPSADSSSAPSTAKMEGIELDGQDGVAVGRVNDSVGAGAAGGFGDPQFVQQMLASLQGVDISDPRIQAALRGVAPAAGSDSSGADGTVDSEPTTGEADDTKK